MSHASATATGGRKPSDDAQGVPVTFLGRRWGNSTFAQWFVYGVTMAYVIIRSWAFFHGHEARTWEDSFGFIMTVIVPVVVLWPAVTYRLHTRIPIDQHGLEHDADEHDQEYDDRPADEEPDDHNTPEYKAYRVWVDHRINVNRDARALLISQFKWAVLLVGLPVMLPAIAIALAPRSMLALNLLMLMVTPILLAGFLALIRLEKPGWSLVPLALLLGVIFTIHDRTDWSEWGMGTSPRGYHAKIAAAREMSARGQHQRAAHLINSASTLTDSASPAWPLQKFELGRVYETAGNYRSALEAYLATLQWYKDRPGVYDSQLQYRAAFNSSVMYWHLGSPSDARTMARQARSILSPQMAGELVQHEGQMIPRLQMVDNHLAFLEGY